MDEKKIQEIQDELLKEIDDEQRIEENIKNSAEEIASILSMQPSVKININNQEFMLSYKIIPSKNKRFIYIVAANTVKYELLGSKYKPYIINAEIDEEYSLKDNLRTVCEGFTRHISGKIKPEMIED